MSARLVFASIAATLALGLAAPAIAKESKAEREARYAERLELARAHAGEPVERVRFLTEPYKFDVLGDHNVLVWQNSRTAWLVDLQADQGCKRMSNSLSIRIDMFNEFQTMNTSNGYIVGDYNTRCKIVGLREVDLAAMRAARQIAKDEAQG